MNKSSHKELEVLFAWAEFYSNSKNLAKPVQPNEHKFKKVQLEIDKLSKKLF